MFKGKGWWESEVLETLPQAQFFNFLYGVYGADYKLKKVYFKWFYFHFKIYLFDDDEDW